MPKLIMNELTTLLLWHGLIAKILQQRKNIRSKHSGSYSAFRFIRSVTQSTNPNSF